MHQTATEHIAIKKIAITYHNYYDYSARNSGLPILLEMQKKQNCKRLLDKQGSLANPQVSAR